MLPPIKVKVLGFVCPVCPKAAVDSKPSAIHNAHGARLVSVFLFHIVSPSFGSEFNAEPAR
jgi:hypothetical protein